MSVSLFQDYSRLKTHSAWQDFGASERTDQQWTTTSWVAQSGSTTARTSSRRATRRNVSFTNSARTTAAMRLPPERGNRRSSKDQPKNVQKLCQYTVYVLKIFICALFSNTEALFQLVMRLKYFFCFLFAIELVTNTTMYFSLKLNMRCTMMTGLLCYVFFYCSSNVVDFRLCVLSCSVLF